MHEKHAPYVSVHLVAISFLLEHGCGPCPVLVLSCAVCFIAPIARRTTGAFPLATTLCMWKAGDHRFTELSEGNPANVRVVRQPGIPHVRNARMCSDRSHANRREAQRVSGPHPLSMPSLSGCAESEALEMCFTMVLRVGN